MIRCGAEPPTCRPVPDPPNNPYQFRCTRCQTRYTSRVAHVAPLAFCLKFDAYHGLGDWCTLLVACATADKARHLARWIAVDLLGYDSCNCDFRREYLNYLGDLWLWYARCCWVRLRHGRVAPETCPACQKAL